MHCRVAGVAASMQPCGLRTGPLLAAALRSEVPFPLLLRTVPAGAFHIRRWLQDGLHSFQVPAVLSFAVAQTLPLTVHLTGQQASFASRTPVAANTALHLAPCTTMLPMSHLPGCGLRSPSPLTTLRPFQPAAATPLPACAPPPPSACPACRGGGSDDHLLGHGLADVAHGGARLLHGTARQPGVGTGRQRYQRHRTYTAAGSIAARRGTCSWKGALTPCKPHAWPRPAPPRPASSRPHARRTCGLKGAKPP